MHPTFAKRLACFHFVFSLVGQSISTLLPFPEKKRSSLQKQSAAGVVLTILSAHCYRASLGTAPYPSFLEESLWKGLGETSMLWGLRSLRATNSLCCHLKLWVINWCEELRTVKIQRCGSSCNMFDKSSFIKHMLVKVKCREAKSVTQLNHFPDIKYVIIVPLKMSKM